jgi:molybdate transport system substrate-binding protein
MLNRHALQRFIGSMTLIAIWLSSSALTALARNAMPPAGTTPSVTLTIFTAASLADAFTELGRNYERYNPGVNVVFNFAGSQVLSQQLNQGAPADVFASANAAQMQAAVRGGRVTSSEVLVRNRLVVVMPAGNPGHIQALPDLARPGLQIVLAAKAVPVGQYALDFLDKASGDPAYGATFKAEVLNNVVSYEDNVKAVLAKVALGEADAGLVYTTDVAGSDAANVKRLYIPDALNTIATYPIAVVNDTPNSYWARGFVRYVLAEDGQLILSKYGFITNRMPTRNR